MKTDLRQKSRDLCDASEDELEPLTVNSNSLSFKAKPFEIITVKINL